MRNVYIIKALAGFLFGYDTGIISGVIFPFQFKFGSRPRNSSYFDHSWCFIQNGGSLASNSSCFGSFSRFRKKTFEVMPPVDISRI